MYLPVGLICYVTKNISIQKNANEINWLRLYWQRNVWPCTLCERWCGVGGV